MRRLRWLGLLPLLAVPALLPLAASTNLTWGFRQDDFRFEAILGVAAKNLDDDGRDELILSGRDYQDGEACLEVLRWEGKGFSPVWRSPNLLESESTLLALAVTWPEGPAIVALTRSNYHIFRYRDGQYAEEARGRMAMTAEEAAAGDLDGDGTDEVIVSVTLRNTKTGREKALRVLSWQAGRLEAGAASDAVGNVRALAAGDLDRDGRAEIVADVGVTTKPGEFHLFRWGNGVLKLLSSHAGLPSACFALSVGPEYPEPGQVIHAAFDSWKMASYRYSAGTLGAGQTNLGSSARPVALTTGDLDGDGRDELVLVSFRARLQVLFPTAPYIGLSLDGMALELREPLRRWDNTIYGEAGALAAIFGWTLREVPDRAEFSFAGPDGRPHVLAVSAGAACTATLDGSPFAFAPVARRYVDRFYLPVLPVANLAGLTGGWDEGRQLIALRRVSPP